MHCTFDVFRRGVMTSKSRIFRSKAAEALAALFGAKKTPEQRPAGSRTNPYHAVSILPGADSCAAAYRFSGQRFLSRQAPRLPLPSCDAATCGCRFKHHKDRRAGPRRSSDVGMTMAGYSGNERRQSRGRRSTDHY